jgi:predicted enzyme related to lactoylglutathione lyase
MSDAPAAGTIAWHDLTVADAETVRDFYAAVVGWQVQPVDMDGYEDFTMAAPGTGEGVAGVCHARGPNADLPPQWLLYVVVEDLDRSVEACSGHGGDVVAAPRPLAGGRFCVVRDPAGAVMALWEPAG